MVKHVSSLGSKSLYGLQFVEEGNLIGVPHTGTVARAEQRTCAVWTESSCKESINGSRMGQGTSVYLCVDQNRFEVAVTPRLLREVACVTGDIAK